MKIEIEIDEKTIEQVQKNFYIESGLFFPNGLLLPECENFIYKAIEEKIKNDNIEFIKSFRESKEKETRYNNFNNAFQDWKREEKE